MARRSYDPLEMIPSPEAIRERLDQTLTLAERLRILLDLSERLQLPITTGETPAAQSSKAKGGCDV